jgi:PAS domain S-box-containing protein
MKKKGSLTPDWLAHHFATILDGLTVGVIVVDHSGRIVAFNQQASELTGIPPPQAMGQKYFDLLGGRVQERATPLYTLTTGIPILNQEKEITRPDGKRVALGYSTSLLHNGAEGTWGALETFYDLAHLRRREDGMSEIRSLASLGQMAASFAHQIRNPLGGIAGFASLLDRDLPEGDYRRRYVQKLLEGVAHLNRTITSLATYVTPIKPRFQAVPLRAFLRKVLDSFEKNWAGPEKGIRISFQRAPGPEVELLLDPELLNDVLQRILRNAGEAMPRGGEISVSVRPLPAPQGPSWAVDIQDRGAGIPPEMMDKVFTPLTSPKPDGAGLSLAYARKVLHALGGEITLSSNASDSKDRGTLVTLTLNHP